MHLLGRRGLVELSSHCSASFVICKLRYRAAVIFRCAGSSIGLKKKTSAVRRIGCRFDALLLPSRHCLRHVSSCLPRRATGTYMRRLLGVCPGSRVCAKQAARRAFSPLFTWRLLRICAACPSALVSATVKQKALSKLAVDFERYAAKRTETTCSKSSVSGVERLKPSLTIPSSTICCDGAKQKQGHLCALLRLVLVDKKPCQQNPSSKACR